MADYNYISDGRPDGVCLGNASTDKVGFYGVTPVVQPSSTTQASVAAQTTATTTALRTDLDATIALANQIRADLVTLGLIKGEA